MNRLSFQEALERRGGQDSTERGRARLAELARLGEEEKELDLAIARLERSRLKAEAEAEAEAREKEKGRGSEGSNESSASNGTTPFSDLEGKVKVLSRAELAVSKHLQRQSQSREALTRVSALQYSSESSGSPSGSSAGVLQQRKMRDRAREETPGLPRPPFAVSNGTNGTRAREAVNARTRKNERPQKAHHPANGQRGKGPDRDKAEPEASKAGGTGGVPALGGAPQGNKEKKGGKGRRGRDARESLSSPLGGEAFKLRRPEHTQIHHYIHDHLVDVEDLDTLDLDPEVHPSLSPSFIHTHISTHTTSFTHAR